MKVKDGKMAKLDSGAVLAAARENEDLLGRAAEVKARAADAAKVNCAALVARAASGAEVDAASLMQAQDEARVAGAEFDIASAIQRGAVHRRQEAEVAVWFEEAERLKISVEQLLDERFAAAAAVDGCFAELCQAVARFNESGQRFLNAKISASQFMADRDVRIAGNPVLAAMAAGTHPNARNNYNAEIRQVGAVVFNVDSSLERPAPIDNLVQREAFLWGRRGKV